MCLVHANVIDALKHVYVGEKMHAMERDWPTDLSTLFIVSYSHNHATFCPTNLVRGLQPNQ